LVVVGVVVVFVVGVVVSVLDTAGLTTEVVVLVAGVVGLVDTTGLVVVVVGLVVVVVGLLVDVPVVAFPVITELGFAVVDVALVGLVFLRVEVIGLAVAGVLLLVKEDKAFLEDVGLMLGETLGLAANNPLVLVVGLMLGEKLEFDDNNSRGLVVDVMLLGTPKSLGARATLVKFCRFERSAKSRALGNCLTDVRFCKIAIIYPIFFKFKPAGNCAKLLIGFRFLISTFLGGVKAFLIGIKFATFILVGGADGLI
jgi:hypothetical protein